MLKGWPFNMSSTWAERTVRFLVTAFVLGIIQNAFAAPEAFALTAPPAISIVGENVSTTFGTPASTTVTTSGGSTNFVGYTYGLTPQVPGITMRSIDSSTNVISVDTLTPAGSYLETFTVMDGNGYQESKLFKISVNHANRKLTLLGSKQLITGNETATIFPYVDSSTPNVNVGIVSSDGRISYSAGNSTGCVVNQQSGTVSTAFSGGTCLITGTVSQGSYYKAASSTVSFKIGNSINDFAYFSKNDGTGLFTTISGAHNSTIKAPDAPTRTDYAFLGWSKSTTGDSLIAPGADINLNGEVTYYAIWQNTLTPTEITSLSANAIGDYSVVTFDPGSSDAGTPPSPINGFVGDTFTIPDSSTLVKANYHFDKLFSW